MSGESVYVGARVEMRGPYGQPWRPATIVWVGSQMLGDRLRVVEAEADDGASCTVLWPHPDLRAPADRVPCLPQGAP